jgi:hypothetical protein
MEITPMLLSFKRLPFKLPEFNPRSTWASAHAREVWEPRIQEVSAAWLQVERESVFAGVRPSALQNVTPEELPELIKQLAPRGLIVLPLSQTPRATGYNSASRAAQPGDALDYRCAITRPEHAAAWAAAWGKDDAAIGALLGTPACCQKFFDRVWKQERWFDTTMPMYAEIPQPTTGVNMLWRWLGVRPVSHLPCSPECAETAALADRLGLLLPEPERSWHREILSWPVLYTSFRGIAEITTPILRMAVPTDALVDKAVVKYVGLGYPDEGVSGVGFPHKTLSKPRTLRLVARSEPHHNGFASLADMNAAHRPLLQAAGGPYNTILDLGCGDGTLASKISARRRIGVESDPERANAAEKRLQRVVRADCTDPRVVADLLREERPDLVIAQRSRNRLDSFPSGVRVLSYSYDPVHVELRNG